MHDLRVSPVGGAQGVIQRRNFHEIRARSRDKVNDYFCHGFVCDGGVGVLCINIGRIVFLMRLKNQVCGIQKLAAETQV
jgi:hypothetical protein